MEVRDNMLNGHRVCHGGFVFALADTAFAFACNTYDRVTLAAGASIEFLRPAKAGDRLKAIASERFRGGRTGLYDVIVSNQDDEQIALFRGRSHATNEAILSRSDT
jgi:acyl-CoA thioesterase